MTDSEKAVAEYRKKLLLRSKEILFTISSVEILDKERKLTKEELAALRNGMTSAMGYFASLFGAVGENERKTAEGMPALPLVNGMYGIAYDMQLHDRERLDG